MVLSNIFEVFVGEINSFIRVFESRRADLSRKDFTLFDEKWATGTLDRHTLPEKRAIHPGLCSVMLSIASKLLFIQTIF